MGRGEASGNALLPPRGHWLDFADARDRFEWEAASVEPSYAGPDGRPRFLAVGFLDGDLVALVFAMLGTEALSAISLRRANRIERRRYAERKTHPA